MARKHEAVQLLHRGKSPARIAAEMGISVESVKGYLFNQVGEGAITRSEILFTIPGEVRQAVEAVEGEVRRISGELGVSHNTALCRSAIKQQLYRQYPAVDREEALLYWELCKPNVYLRDMYWLIYVVESFMHTYIKVTLKRAYGDNWWRKGIPENIRAECAAVRERDPEPAAEPYCYTTLIHIKEIFERRWDLFSKTLSDAPVSDRRRFLSELTRLNQIRNRVMHPAKGILPTEADFRFVHEFIIFVDFHNWSEAAETLALIE